MTLISVGSFFSSPHPDILDFPISATEFCDAVKDLQTGKASGPDMIANEMLRSACPTLQITFYIYSTLSGLRCFPTPGDCSFLRQFFLEKVANINQIITGALQPVVSRCFSLLSTPVWINIFRMANFLNPLNLAMCWLQHLRYVVTNLTQKLNLK